jgi:hypothetical protein
MPCPYKPTDRSAIGLLGLDWRDSEKFASLITKRAAFLRKTARFLTPSRQNFASNFYFICGPLSNDSLRVYVGSGLSLVWFASPLWGSPTC